MKKIALVLFLSFTATVLAQDTYLQGDDERAEERAEVLSEKYNQELSMGAEQQVLFEKKMTEFLIREEKIRSLDMPHGDKLKTLTKLSVQETAEMRNILTRPQWRFYKKLKKKYQPILVEVGEVDK